MSDLPRNAALGAAPVVERVDARRRWVAALLVAPLLAGGMIVAFMVHISIRWPALAARPTWGLVLLAVAFITLSLATRFAFRMGSEKKAGTWTAAAVVLATMGVVLPMICWGRLLGG